MESNKTFINKDNRFWALAKIVSETAGYSERQKGKTTEKKMKIYSAEDVLKSLNKLELPTSYYFTESGMARSHTKEVIDYLNYRNMIIQTEVKGLLMDRQKAKELYEYSAKRLKSKLKIHMNKQKGEKRHPSYLTNMVNLHAESVLGVGSFDCDPMALGIVVDDVGPVKTLCRRMDGAYPSTCRPKIMWEVKEYYGTTTFGSRIADGVYETMLVGEEFKELKRENNIKVHHVLFVDDYFTWWILGRSYLCRLVDLMHMGYVDAVFFGKEVADQWPKYLARVIKSPSQK